MGIGPLGINFCFSAVLYSHGNIPLGINFYFSAVFYSHGNIPLGIKPHGNQTPWELVSWELIFDFQLFFIPVGTFPWESNPMGMFHVSPRG